MGQYDTRRKLVSTSYAADTGLHSTANIPAITDSNGFATICFWIKAETGDLASSNNTLWATYSAGGTNEQIYNGASANQDILQGRYANDGSRQAIGTLHLQDGTYLGEWVHFVFHFGVDVEGTAETSIWENGTNTAGRDDASPGTSPLESAGVHFVLGDDASDGTTDDGFDVEIFDFCLLDGKIAIADLNYDSGSWADLSATAEAALMYRLDGQNATAGSEGEDSSGNGNHFTVEASGVTSSLTDLPPGANPTAPAGIEWIHRRRHVRSTLLRM